MGRYFTLTSVHLATLALKDELNATLRNELSVARADRLRAEEARDAAVSKAFELLTPKPAQVASPEARLPSRPTPPTLDLSEVDPGDMDAIRDLALSEMGSGKMSASFLTQKIESIKAQIYLAHAAKKARAQQVGTIVSEVPQAVQDAISAAEQQGKAQARVQ